MISIKLRQGLRRAAIVALAMIGIAPLGLLATGSGVVSSVGVDEELLSVMPPPSAQDQAPDRLIVQFKSSAARATRGPEPLAMAGAGSLVAQGQRLLSGLDAAERNALSQVGGMVLRGHERLGILVVRPRMAVGAAVESLLRSGTVAYAEPDYRLRTSAVPGDPQFGQQWGLHNIGQEVPAGSGRYGTSDADIDGVEAWDVQRVAPGVVVAVVDSGVDYRHPDLALNMWVNPGEVAGNGIDDDGNGWVDDVHGVDACDQDGDPDDDNGHGTHVAGIVGARGDNGVGVTGVAWRTKIMALKFLCADGQGFTSDAAAVIDYALAMKETYGYTRMIVNASWQGSEDSSALSWALYRAEKAGVLIVAAAGDEGRDTDVMPSYPSGHGYLNILSVGASDLDDAPAAFSNHGCGAVDFYAPGIDILSTAPRGGYRYQSGTSMSAPLVTGIAALLWQRHATRGVADIRTMLTNSVDDVPALEGQAASQGRINLHAALGAPWNVPTVWRLHPAAVGQGGTVIIEGDNFGDSLGSVTMGGIPLTITGWSSDQIYASLPSSAPLGLYKVQVTDAAGRSGRAGGCLSVTHAPTLAGRLVVPRHWAATAQVGRDLYVIGGGTDRRQTGLVERYSLDTNQSVLDTAWSMPFTATNAGAAAIDGKIHVVGGYDWDTGEVFKRLQIFDTATTTWRVGRPLPEPRMQAAVVAVKGKLYVFGGKDGSGNVTATTFVYDPVTGAWSRKTSMPEPRSYAAAVQQGTGDLAWVMGGFATQKGRSVTPSVYVYNTATDSWATRPPMNVTRAGFAAAFHSLGAIVAVHGVGLAGECCWGAQSDGEYYDRTRWRHQIHGTQRLYTPGAGRVGKIVYIVGGWDEDSYKASANVWRLTLP